MPGWLQRVSPVHVLVLALTLPLLACGETETAAPDFGGDALPLPAEQVGEMRLTRIDVDERRAPATVVVTEIAGEVVTVTSSRLSALLGPGGALADQGRPGPPLVDGRSTVEFFDQVFNISPALAIEGGTPDEVITAAGRGQTPAELAAVLGQVTLPLDNPSAVPGRVIGVLHLPDPDGIRVAYETGGGTILVTIDELSRSEREAYRALLHEDPAASIDPMTEASCCPAGILEPPREVSIGTRSGLVATLTPYQRVLLVDGDPGLLVRPFGGTEVPEDELIAMAAALRSGSVAQREELRSTLVVRQREAQAAQATAAEEAIGWEVIERVDEGEVAIIVSSGAEPRPNVPVADPRLCATIGGQGSTATCLAEATGAELVVAEPRFDVIFGSAPPATRSVSIDFLRGSIDATVLHLDPAPGRPSVVFVSHTTVSEQIELTGDLSTENMAAIQVVARDETGAVVARAPLFPHLRGG